MTNENMALNFIENNLNGINKDKFVYLQLILASIICSIGFIDNSILILIIAILLSPIGNIILDIPKKLFLKNKENKSISIIHIFLKLLLVIVIGIVTAICVEIVYNRDNELKQPNEESYLQKTNNLSLYYAIPVSICVGLIYGISHTTGIVSVGITILLKPLISFGLYLGKIIRYNIWKSNYDELDTQKGEEEATNAEIYENLLTQYKKPMRLFIINIISIIGCLLIFSYYFIQKAKKSQKKVEIVNTEINELVKPIENPINNNNLEEKIMDNLTEDSFYDNSETDFSQ